MRAGGVEDPHHDLLAPEGGQGIDAKIDGLGLGYLHLDPAVLGLAPFGDIQGGHHLQACGDAGGQLDGRLGHFMQHPVGTKAHAVGALVGLEVQVGGAAADGVQQHLVDEAHHRGIVGVHATWGVLLVFVDRLDVHAIQVNISEVLHAAAGGVEELLDGIAQLVVFDQDGLGVQAGAELDIGNGLVVGGVGDAHEQLVAPAPERQGAMLANQLFAH
ncbi:hypothetical protein FQZ97_398160 [compost metagenome]